MATETEYYSPFIQETFSPTMNKTVREEYRERIKNIYYKSYEILRKMKDDESKELIELERKVIDENTQKIKPKSNNDDEIKKKELEQQKNNENNDENKEQSSTMELAQETKNKLCVENMILRYDDKYTEIQQKFLKKPYKNKKQIEKLKKLYKLINDRPRGWENKLLKKKYTNWEQLINDETNEGKKKRKDSLETAIANVQKDWKYWDNGWKLKNAVHALMRKTIHAKMGFIFVDQHYFDKANRKKNKMMTNKSM
mmetsp:Transcript_87765/g.107551  ORF Transcript_87765/g.107551 Transcript_87765/m.107551 type:complete len:255 (-) Transcript_87765:15-779(-)